MNKLLWAILLMLTASLPACHAQSTSIATLSPQTPDLMQASMQLADAYWDDTAHLLRNPRIQPPRITRYLVRESAWYAFSLLLRDQPGDRQRASDILTQVLSEQYLDPHVPWYGTFRRSPEEPTPSANAVLWENYDPNWREFIGATFAYILIDLPDRIPAPLATRMYAAIDTAVAGELAQGRLTPAYSNVALMHGFLWSFSAAHAHCAPCARAAASWSNQVYRRFRRHRAFDEYNSPTYYGVDLYALALWRQYGATDTLRRQGSAMEAQLWQDIALLYNPSLHNLSGPYDRAYGVDMQRYVSLLGVWIETIAPTTPAPLPPIIGATDHVADIWLAPQILHLGAHLPPNIIARLTTFQGDHTLHKSLSEGRIVTASLSKDLMIGGEATGKRKGPADTNQYAPATIHWKTPTGSTGWISVLQSPPLDATADTNTLHLQLTGTVKFHIIAPDLNTQRMGRNQWRLPGLTIEATSDAHDLSVEEKADGLDVTYTGVRNMQLKIAPTQSQ